jgi:hypothetical protein
MLGVERPWLLYGCGRENVQEEGAVEVKRKAMRATGCWLEKEEEGRGEKSEVEAMRRWRE